MDARGVPPSPRWCRHSAAESVESRAVHEIAAVNQIRVVVWNINTDFFLDLIRVRNLSDGLMRTRVSAVSKFYDRVIYFTRCGENDLKNIMSLVSLRFPF